MRRLSVLPAEIDEWPADANPHYNDITPDLIGLICGGEIDVGAQPKVPFKKHSVFADFATLDNGARAIVHVWLNPGLVHSSFSKWINPTRGGVVTS